MKKVLFIACILLLSIPKTFGQGEQNTWVFGAGTGIDFNTSTPTPISSNLIPGYEGCASICNANGQLLFYTNGCWVWNANGEIVRELTGGVPGYTSPTFPIAYPPMMPYTGSYPTQATAITNVPTKPGNYYIFSLCSDGRLFYTIVNMSLNGGTGGIVTNKKGLQLAAGLTEKMTVVKGCNNLWVVTRSATNNQYLAYEINDTGIVTTPVVSSVGMLPVSLYRTGVIKFSPDGHKMAAACSNPFGISGGLEVYDFNPSTGVLSNTMLLDSSSTKGYYYGACFSTSQTKLYASTSSFAYAGTFYYGKVRQFDLSLGNAAAIAASNTIVYTDNVNQPDNIGDLKCSLDGKIYFGSGMPFTPYLSHLHRINSPNLSGTACGVQPNAIAMPSGKWSYRGLPNDIALVNPPDTIRLPKIITACFRDSLLITADTGKNYKWNNGSTIRSQTVHANGNYIAGFINANCDYERDTFKVRFIPLPVITSTGYSCPKQKQAMAWVKPHSGDTTTFSYSWKDAIGNVLRQTSNHGDTLKGLDPGTYSLQITTSTGCDTSLYLTILPLPVPTLAFTVDSIVCKGVAVSFTTATNAPTFTWHFGDNTTSQIANPEHTYPLAKSYTAYFTGTSIEGCSDTFKKVISVRELDLNLVTSKETVNRGEQIQLITSANVSYSVTSWNPVFMFTDQTAYQQDVKIDTERTFIVTGISEDGCIGQAKVDVGVNPIVFIPSAFTPNGDGKNDRLRPISYGYIFVRYFEIYNRFGQQVFFGNGITALEGWNGTFGGVPCDMGTYFYRINMLTEKGEVITLKGDVTLIR